MTVRHKTAGLIFAAAQICSAASGNLASTHSHHPAPSAKATRRVWNPTKPAQTVDLDKEPYAVFASDGDGIKLISKLPSLDIDAPRALASHIKLLTAACALDAMRANSSLMTPGNIARLRTGLLRSSNEDMQALAQAVAPDPTDDGVRAMLRAKADSLGLSKYFDVENASGFPEPKKKGDPRQDSYGTIRDVIKIGFDLFGKKENRDFLKKYVYSDIKPSEHLTNYAQWNADGIFLATKTATAKGGTAIADDAGFRTMFSFFDDGRRQLYVFHPNSYTDPRAPSSVQGSLFDQFLHAQGVVEPPRFAAWLNTIERQKFPTVRAAVAELERRYQQSVAETVARLAPRAKPQAPAKSHYSRARELSLRTAIAAKVR